MTIRCTCGYTVFSERLNLTTAIVERWMFTSDEEAEGFGATPFGTGFGSGESGDWGLYEVSLTSGAKEKYCQSCKRIRLSQVITGITPLGSYRVGDYLYVVAGDARAPATCFSLRFTGPGGVYTSQLALWSEEAPAVFNTPLETAEEPPEGAVLADVQLRAKLPIVDVTGTYLVEVVDSCAQVVLPLVELELEQEIGMQVLGPMNADLNGAPALWLRGFTAAEPASPQPAGAANLTIPFDKCLGVVEYDARQGTLPGSQGWTYTGDSTSADFALVDGGAMRAEIDAGDTSYWDAILALDASPAALHSYMVALRQDVAGKFELRAIASYDATTHYGARLSMEGDEVRAREIDGGTGTSQTLTAQGPFGWEDFGGSVEKDGDEVAWLREQMLRMSPAVFGSYTEATATQLRVQFGALVTGGATAYVRNVVASVGGRFIRAGFAGIAIATAPLLRFYFSRETRATTNLVARFRLRYGQGTNPYANPATTAVFSVPVPTANTLLEIPVGLSGLTAGQPFWFQIERAWDDAADVFEGTVHLHNVTVRSA